MPGPAWQCDGVALAEKIGKGVTTPVDILEQVQARIGALNPKLNAVVCLNPEAMADARASAERHAAKRPLSRIDGLPVLVKDNLVVRGMPAIWGSRLYEGRVCDHDEIPVEKLRRAGAVIVGKTNVPEFTVEGFTDNPVFGVTPNPWDLTVTPGGSSGGSVAAVAAGLAPLSIGTDGGGSIRRPAAYTNLVGLKTTIGRVPRGGGLPQLLLDMEVVGPITRSVRDQALLFDVLAQPDRRDHRSLRFDGARSAATLNDPPGPLKVLAQSDRRDHRSLRFAGARSAATLHGPPKPLNVLSVERFAEAPLDPAIGASFQETVALMTAMGHRVETGDLPLDIAAISENWASIANIGLALLLQREPRMRELASRKYVEWADTPHDAAHLLNVLEVIADLRNQAARAFEKIDIIMTPSCAAMPWSTGIPFPPEIDSRPVGPRGSAVYTGWVNACGHPAISVPGPMSEGGMPIGTQFVGGFGQDELLLRLAQQIETRQSWLDRWPRFAFEAESSS